MIETPSRRRSARTVRELACCAGLCLGASAGAGLFPASATWNVSVTSSWETGSNWTGGTSPDNDGVLLWTANITQFDGAFYDVNLSTDVTVSALNMDSRFADLEVLGPASLGVLGATTVTAGEVRIAGEATFDGLFTTGNSSGRAGFLTLAGGTATLNGGMQVNDGGVFGQGLLRVGGGTLNNEDQIRGALGGTLTIDLDGGALDMDGIVSGTGQVQALLGSVMIDGGITDAFNGSVQVGSGWEFGLSNNWTVGSGGVVEFITGEGTVSGGEINLTGTGQLRTNGGNGTVDSDVSINGGTLAVNAGETMTLNGSVDMSAGALTVAGTLNNANTLGVFGGAATIASGGTLVNTGSIRLHDGGPLTGPGLLRNNNGVIDFVEDSFVSVGQLDLDGSAGGEGSVIVRQGVTGTFAAPNVETGGGSFDGTLDLRGGTLVMQLAGAWSLANGSDLLSSVDASALTSNQALTLSGRIDVDEELTISAPSYTLGATADVDIASGATLQFTGSGARTILGGTYAGAGTLSIGGPQNINGDVTFDVNVLDWDGQEGGGWTTLIGDGVSVVINSAQMESGNPATDGYDGIVRIGVGSTLEVNTASDWRMDGALILRQNALLTTSGARGDAPMARIFGDLLVFAGETGTVDAPIALEASSDTIVDGGETLLLSNAFFRGGDVFGGGTLYNAGVFTVEAHQAIDVTTLDWDGAGNGQTYVNAGASLTISSDFLDAGNNIFDGYVESAGALTIGTLAGAWENAGTVNLTGGSLNGDDLNNSGNLQGRGDVNVRVNNEGTIRAVGGVLRLDDNDVHDYDGLGEAGEMWAQNGSLVIENGSGAFGFDGLVRIGGGNTFDAGGLDLFFNPNGRLRFVGDGTYAADLTTMGGSLDVDVGAGATHEGELRLQAGSATDVAGSLTHSAGDLVIGAGANVTVQSGGTFTAQGDSFTNQNGSLVTVDGVMNLESASQTFAPGSVISVSSTGRLNLRSDVTLSSAGLFQVAGQARVDGAIVTLSAGPSAFGGSGDLRLINDGQLRGAGAIGLDVLNIGGFLEPNFSAIGQFGVQGDYTQLAGGAYNVDLTASASDRVVVTGNAWLAGSLNVFVGAFTPQWGDEWEIMTFAGGNGEFDQVTYFGGSLGENLLWYTERTATSYLIGVRDVADVNHDGVVDFSDLNAVLAQFGAAGAGLIGDANEDGLVDFSDLNTVLVRFGLTAPAALRAVPAPGAAAALALGALMAGRRRR